MKYFRSLPVMDNNFVVDLNNITTECFKHIHINFS